MSNDRRPAPILNLASLGGFGHSVIVFDEMLEHAGLARLTAMAPAHEEETLRRFREHPVVSRDHPRIYQSPAALWDHERPDVAVVSTQPAKIASLVGESLRAGCHVIAEKPLATTASALSDLFALWREKDLSLMAMLNTRGTPAFAAARRVYHSGRIGEVVAANARKSYRWGSKRPAWFGERSLYGGTFPWIGIHALDMINLITGQRFVETAAMHGNVGHPDFPGCEDVCVGLFRMENGAMAAVSADYFRPSSASSHGDDWCRIVGTRGVMEANASQGWCRVLCEGDSVPQDVPLGEGPAPVFASFLEAVRNEPTSRTHEEHALTAFHLTDACLAARESAETGSFVQIDPKRWN